MLRDEIVQFLHRDRTALAAALALPRLDRACLAFSFDWYSSNSAMICLPGRRDAQVKGGAQRHGHGKRLLRSWERPEQFIEKVAEPSFEHVELSLGDWDALGPVVRDGPRRNVVLDRAPEPPRPWAG